MPNWVLSSGGVLADLDIDFVHDRAWSGGAEVSIASLLTCSRASTSYYTNASGALTSFGSNTARYGNRGLLVESTRTNILLQSQTLDNASWNTESSLTVSADVDTAPDGTATADRINITANEAFFRQGVTVAENTAYVFSFYAKRGTATVANYSVFNHSSPGDIVATTSYFASTDSSNYTRIVVPFTTPAGCTSISTYIWRGDNQNGNTWFLWGAQLEAGAFATSYIPTTTTSVTRPDEANSIGVISGTVHTFYSESLIPQIGNASGIYDSENFGGRIILRGDNGDCSFGPSDGISFGVPTANVPYKYAIALATNDMAGSRNGGAIQTDTSVTVTAITGMGLGCNTNPSAHINGHLQRFAWFNERLSNAALQTLGSEFGGHPYYPHVGQLMSTGRRRYTRFLATG